MADEAVREWTLHDVPERVRGHATVAATVSGPAVRHGSMETALSKRDVERKLRELYTPDHDDLYPDDTMYCSLAAVAEAIGLDIAEAAS